MMDADITRRTAALIESDRIAVEAIERRMAAGDAPAWDEASYEWMVHGEDRPEHHRGCWYCTEPDPEPEIPGQIELWPREDN